MTHQLGFVVALYSLIVGDFHVIRKLHARINHLIAGPDRVSFPQLTIRQVEQYRFVQIVLRAPRVDYKSHHHHHLVVDWTRQDVDFTPMLLYDLISPVN